MAVHPLACAEYMRESLNRQGEMSALSRQWDRVRGLQKAGESLNEWPSSTLCFIIKKQTMCL